MFNNRERGREKGGRINISNFGEEEEEERGRGRKWGEREGSKSRYVCSILRWIHFAFSSFSWSIPVLLSSLLPSLPLSLSPSLSLGLDPKLLASILNTASGRCWSCDTYNPCPGVMEGVPASNNYQGGFGTSLMAKVDSYDYGLLFQLNVNLVEEIGRPLFSAPGIKTPLAQLLADCLAMHHRVLLSLPHQVEATQLVRWFKKLSWILEPDLKFVWRNRMRQQVCS